MSRLVAPGYFIVNMPGKIHANGAGGNNVYIFPLVPLDPNPSGRLRGAPRDSAPPNRRRLVSSLFGAKASCFRLTWASCRVVNRQA